MVSMLGCVFQTVKIDLFNRLIDNRNHLSYLTITENKINSFVCSTPIDQNWTKEIKLKRTGK